MRISFKISKRSAQMDWAATFELREVITPYGKANNLDSGNTFLWNQSIDRLRIYRQPPSLIGQFLHENWSIKTEILVSLGFFYSFFKMLSRPDPRTTQDDKQKKVDNPRERNISNRKYLTPFCSDRLIDSDIVGSLSNQKRRCCGFTSGILPEHGPAFRQ